MTTATASEQRERILNVFLDGSCFDLCIGFPRFEATLDPEDLGLKAEDVPDIYKLGKKQLIEKRAIGIFQTLDAKARRELEWYSLSFPIPNVRFVPNRTVSALVERLEVVKKEFFERAEEFLKKYKTLKEETLAKYAEHRKALEDYYPSHASLASKFHFSYQMFAIALPPKLHKKAVDARSLSDAESKAQAIIAEKSADLVKDFDTWADDMVKGARKAAQALFQVAYDKMRGGEVIHPKTIEALKGHIQRFRSLNVIGDTAMEESLTKAIGLLDAGCDSAFTRTEFEAACKEIVETASKVTDVNAITGTYKRRLMEIDA